MKTQDEGFDPSKDAINEALEHLRLSEIESKIRDVYNLKEEIKDFADKMTIAIDTIKKNPDLSVTENNYQEMGSLYKNLKHIIDTFGPDRQQELRESIKGEIGDVIEEIELLPPNSPEAKELFDDTDADQLTFQEIANYVTYKYNLKGIQTTVDELNRKVESVKKTLENLQPQGFFSQREQNNNNLSEDLHTKKTFYIYYIKLGKGVLGYGITNSPKRRHKEHMQNFADNGIVAEKIYQFRGDAPFIEELELKIKREFPQVDIGIDGFKNEATGYEYKDEIIEFIDNFDY